MDLARLHPNSRAGIKTGERKAQPLFDSFPGIFNWHGKHNTKYSVLQKKKKNTSMGFQLENKQKKVQKKKPKPKNTPFGILYKGEEVLLSEADKVTVRLSLVKIDVLPFFL